MPRPSTGAVAIVAAAAATLLGTGMNARSTAAQIVAAVVVAGLTLAVVPLAARRRPGPVTYAVASAAAGAAAIHYAVTAEHFEEWWLFGLFFIATGIAQLVWAVVVVASRSRLLIWLGIVGNAAIVVLWIVTRTVGTLVGPEPDMPEPVAVADSIATAFEVVIVVGSAWLAANARARSAMPLRPACAASGVMLVATTIGLLSVLD